MEFTENLYGLTVLDTDAPLKGLKAPKLPQVTKSLEVQIEESRGCPESPGSPESPECPENTGSPDRRKFWIPRKS